MLTLMEDIYISTFKNTIINIPGIVFSSHIHNKPYNRHFLKENDQMRLDGYILHRLTNYYVLSMGWNPEAKKYIYHPI